MPKLSNAFLFYHLLICLVALVYRNHRLFKLSGLQLSYTSLDLDDTSHTFSP